MNHRTRIINDDVKDLTLEIWYRLYETRKKRGRGFASIADDEDATI